MTSKILLPPNQPLKFEGRNIRTPKRSNATDDVYILQMEITRDVWESLESVPKIALLEGVIWHHDGDTPEQAPVVEARPKREKKPKPAKGEHGRFWQEMYRSTFQNNPSIWEALEVTGPEMVKEALKAHFGVDSLSCVSPKEFETWASRHRLENLVTQSRNAEAKTLSATNGTQQQ